MTDENASWQDWPADTVVEDDGLDIPEFLKISAETRKAAWRTWRGFPNEQGAKAVVSPIEHSQRLYRAGQNMRREQKRVRLERFLGARAQRDQGRAIPASKRRWDPIQCRYVGED